MADQIEDCLHSEGLRATSGSEYCCPLCEECLDLDGVSRWVQTAEKSRDEAYSIVEGDGFGEIVRQGLQREAEAAGLELLDSRYALRSLMIVALFRKRA